MVEIEIDERQREYLEQLRTQLADDHVGEYGHVRYRDAVQYLIDQNEAAAGEEGTDAGGEVTGAVDVEDEDTETDESEVADEDTDDGGSASRLQRMMGLLDNHDDVWERTDSEEGRYAVTLPDGSTEHVRTKDDVRALLFQHYD